jgi:hypothetical protein
MSRHVHVHIYRDFDPSEHPRGGRGQFGEGPGKPLQSNEHPRNTAGVFVQGTHPGKRSDRQKRERTDLVGSQK